MGLGSGHMTTTTHAAFIPERWSNEVILATVERLVARGISTDYGAFAKGDEGFGDIVHIPDVSNFAVKDKAAQTAVQPAATQEGDNTITVNKHKYVAYLIEDRMKKIAINRYLRHYSPKAGHAVAKAMDSDLLALYATLTNNVGDGNTKISRANLVKANWYLDNADVPGEDRFFVVHAHGKADLLELDEYTLYEKTGEKGKLLTGIVGEVLGIPVATSTNIPVSSATPNVVHNILGHKEWAGYVMPQPPRPQNEYKLEYLGWLYVVDAIYGVALLRADFAVDFRSKERT